MALAEWAAVAQGRRFEAGEVVVQGGQEPEGLVCLLEGSLQMFVEDGDRLEPSGHQSAPTWIGAVPTLTETVLRAHMTARTPVRIALVPAVEFRRLALAHPAVHRRIMRQVRPVVARFTAIEQSRERLAALGTMSAGLAHELNNPASAARRSAADLAEALDVIGATLRELVQAGVERDAAGRIADLRDQALHQCAERSALSALDARTPRTRCASGWRRSACPTRGDWPNRSLPADSTRSGSSRCSASAGTATPAALRSVAASLSAQRLVSRPARSRPSG